MICTTWCATASVTMPSRIDVNWRSIENFRVSDMCPKRQFFCLKIHNLARMRHPAPRFLPKMPGGDSSHARPTYL